MVPLSATGDGNCLFNSASIWLTGNESIAPTLRMLTAAELFAHSDFCSTHPQLPRCAQEADFSAGTLVTIFLSNKKAEEVFNGDKKKINSAIEMLALETAKPYEYASPFVILALASVLGRPIFSVYPDIPSTISIKFMEFFTQDNPLLQLMCMIMLVTTMSAILCGHGHHGLLLPTGSQTTLFLWFHRSTTRVTVRLRAVHVP